jgi:hypothetical protein
MLRPRTLRAVTLPSAPRLAVPFSRSVLCALPRTAVLRAPHIARRAPPRPAVLRAPNAAHRHAQSCPALSPCGAAHPVRRAHAATSALSQLTLCRGFAFPPAHRCDCVAPPCASLPVAHCRPRAPLRLRCAPVRFAPRRALLPSRTAATALRPRALRSPSRAVASRAPPRLCCVLARFAFRREMPSPAPRRDRVAHFPRAPCARARVLP